MNAAERQALRAKHFSDFCDCPDEHAPFKCIGCSRLGATVVWPCEVIQVLDDFDNALQEIAKWMQETLCYPYDFSANPPVPKILRLPITQLWIEECPDLTIDPIHIALQVAEEGHWLDDFENDLISSDTEQAEIRNNSNADALAKPTECDHWYSVMSLVTSRITFLTAKGEDAFDNDCYDEQDTNPTEFAYCPKCGVAL